MTKKSLFKIIVYFVFSYNLSAQKIVKITGVKGEYQLASNSELSPKAAHEKALNEAKLNALRKAGIAEHISSSDVLTKQQQGSDLKQIFNSISAVEISGAIINDTIVSEPPPYIDNFGNTVFSVTINAEVIKYESHPNPSFDFEVEGLREAYEDGDMLLFSFLPLSQGYLKIFNLNDVENFLVYPYFDKQNSFLNDKTDKLFGANEKVKFPINNLIGNPNTKESGYILESEKENSDENLVFVFTKENFPFKGSATYNNITSWIYRIPPDKRKVEYFKYRLHNKNKKQN